MRARPRRDLFGLEPGSPVSSRPRRVVAAAVSRWAAALVAALGGAGGEPARRRSALVVELSRLGDAIVAHSVAAHLKRTGFSASVSLAVDAAWAGLFESAGAVDRIVPVPSGGRRLSDLRGLTAAGHDLVLNASPSVRNTLATFLASAPERAGYLDLTSPLTPFRDEFVVVRSSATGGARGSVAPGTTLAERAHPVLALLGAPVPVDLTRLCPTGADAVLVAAWARARWGLQPTGLLVVLHPGATWRFRTWPSERWITLGRSLVAVHGARLVVLGSAAEHALVGRVVAGIASDRAAGWVGRPLGEVAALLAVADLHVGADSGPLHLASALGTPAVGLFGPASPRLTAPLGFRGEALHVAYPCAPCDQRGCVRPVDPCIHALTVAAVVAAAERVWRSVSRG
jgi:ADP-heptose:LPS heptosyltransferase